MSQLGIRPDHPRHLEDGQEEIFGAAEDWPQIDDHIRTRPEEEAGAERGGGDQGEDEQRGRQQPPVAVPGRRKGGTRDS